MSVEILSPAGSMESLVAALRCGANAVYIGGKSFSARANASNFTIEEIKEAADLCHVYGSKLHVAINTICFNEEIEDLKKYIADVAKCNVDAFIVQDLGVCEIMKEVAPQIERHASTQMTIHNVAGAIWAKKNGFTRVVLARELSLEEIKKICEIDIEVECFIHGALCMCVSGQCFMSAMIGGRSANRGNCAQSCRLPFSATKNEYYALSLKDLSLVEHMEELKKAGVKSFKIEGRMKRPEYVAIATKAVNDALNGISPDMEVLRNVFSRSGFTDGYLTGKHEDMFGTRTKADVIDAKKIFPSIHELYRYNLKKRSLKFHIEVKQNIPFTVTAEDSNGNKTVVKSDIPQIASKRPIEYADLEKCFSKLGDTVYSFDKISYDMDDNLFLPASLLNSVRRQIVENIDALQIEKYNKDFSKSETKEYSEILEYNNHYFENFWISVYDERQLEVALKYITKFKKIIIPLRLAKKITDYKEKDKIIISLPRFTVSEDKIYKSLEDLKADGLNEIMCTNISYVEMAEKIGLKLNADFGMNIVNDYSIQKLQNMNFESAVLSPELKLSQIYNIKSSLKQGIYIYGRLPLMITRNCPVKNQLKSCSKCNHELIDRTGRKMKVYCQYGMSEIYNSDKIYLANKMKDIKNVDFGILFFTDETPKETEKIISDYLFKTDSAPSGMTNGLYYRGLK